MDFASLMSKEISKAKSDSPAPQSSTSDTPDKPYVKRSELEAARLEAYNAEQERLRRERDERLERKRKLDDEEAERQQEREEKRKRLAEESRLRREEEAEAKERERRRRLGLSETPVLPESDSKEGTPLTKEEEEQEEEEQGEMDADEVITKLRARGEPARLFGESEKGRLRRYRRLVRRESSAPQQQLSDGPIPTTLALLPESQMKVPEIVPTDPEGRKYLFRQLASYFTMILKEWEVALSKRDASVKQTLHGKQAYNAMLQSRENMKPMFRLFEDESIEQGVLEPVVEIVRHAQNRRYVDANDGYLRLSIGKAAWPIGVTMVGIHARSAREKLHEGGNEKAHIMSDESTRKYLQSIKRCLTFAQVRWPPDDQLQLMG